MAMRHAIPLARRALACTLLALGGCGGGLYVGIGDDFDDPPEVALVSAVASAAAGDTLRLVAAASDDFGIDFVRLYQVAEDGSLLPLQSDGAAPFEWSVILPAAASGRVRFMARAYDDAGQRADSNLVEIMLR